MGPKYNFTAEEIPEQEVQHETVSSTLIRKAISEGYIQRANAYLDHYYIIIGTPALYEADYLPDTLSFFNLSVTEETKLLPAPGIYAVSTGNNSASSRGMVVIYKDITGKTGIYLHPFNTNNIFTGKKTTIFFHKKIYGSIEPGNTNLMADRLKSAIMEISDLIY